MSHDALRAYSDLYFSIFLEHFVILLISLNSTIRKASGFTDTDTALVSEYESMYSRFFFAGCEDKYPEKCYQQVVVGINGEKRKCGSGVFYWNICPKSCGACGKEP